MPFYLSGPTLAEAVERLSTCRAKPSLCNFLILKHAMTQGDGTVTLGLGDATYVAAVDALTAVTTTDDEDSLPPYFNPFGAHRQPTGGWRTKKYPSNGPAVTVPGAGWSQVIVILSQRPRRVGFTDDYLEHLGPVIMLDNDLHREKALPNLHDCAMWLHRDRPIQEDAVHSGAALELMIDRFVEETGLSADERRLIFSGGK
ncbi:MAG TPA: hypothetical protein VNC16_10790 [Solirubrobacterales bacterium]|nr:hypothetical protein [Solirubrobacterales bacterium]